METLPQSQIGRPLEVRSLGSLFRFAATLAFGKGPLYRTLGDALLQKSPAVDTLTTNILGQRYVLVTHPDDVLTVLRPHEKATQKPSSQTQSLEIAQTPNVFTTQGAPWAEKRRAIADHLSAEKGIPQKTVAIEHLIQTTLAGWPYRKNIRPNREMAMLTLKIFSRTMMTYPLSDDDAEMLNLHSSTGLQRKFFYGIFLRNVFSSSMKDSILTGATAKTQDAFEQFLLKVIRFKKEYPIARPGDYFDQVMESSGYDKNPSPENFKKLSSDMTIMLFAGHETLTNTLFWTLQLLARHRDIQTQLAGADGKTRADLSRRVVMETMRLYPSVYMMQRDAMTDITLRQTTAQTGDRLVIPVWSIHRDPRHFDNPEVFKPDRFLPENKDKITRGTYIPFGEGPHMCPGKGLALQEACMIVVAITKNYDLRPVEQHLPKPAGLLTMSPSYDAPLFIEPREAVCPVLASTLRSAPI